MGNEVRVRATVDDKVSGPLDRIKDKFEVLGKKGAGASFLGNLGAMGVSKGLDLLASGIGVVTDQIGQSIEAASEMNETLSKSRVVFGDNSREIEKWGDTAARAFGTSKNDAIAAASSFADLFNTVGLGAGKAQGMSTKLVELSADLASFHNIAGGSVEVLEKLRSGLSGEAEPMRRLGVFLSETKVKAKAAELGLGGAHGELTEGEKILARYNIILDETKTAQGDFTRTSDDLANAQRIVNAELENSQAALGEKLLPAQLAVTQGQLDFIAGLGAVGDLMANKVTPETIALSVALGDMTLAQAEARLAALEASTAYTDMETQRAQWTGGAKAGAVDVVQAFEDMGDAAKTTATDLKSAVAKMKAAHTDLRNSLVTDTDDVVSQAFEVYNDEVEISATMTEKAELRKIIATGNATAEQKARYQELVQRQTELIVELAENGRENTEIVGKAVEDIQKDLEYTQAPVQRAIKASVTLIDELRSGIARTSLVLANFGRDYVNTMERILGAVWPNGAPGGGWQPGRVEPRASGGPVKAGAPYIVGEEGPELMIPSGSGTIVPNGALRSGVGVGPLTITVNVMGSGIITPGVGQEIARTIGPYLADYTARR